MSNGTAIDVIFFDLGDTLVLPGKGWIPNARELLQRLHRRNLRLGIISNTADLTRQDVVRLLPRDFDMTWFEDHLVILSSEVHVEKPSVEIFQLALQKAGIAPDKILFCTEDLLDTLVAQCVGMHSVRLTKTLAEELGKLESFLITAGYLQAE